MSTQLDIRVGYRQVRTSLLTTQETLRQIEASWNRGGGAHIRMGDGDFNILNGKDDLHLRAGPGVTDRYRWLLSAGTDLDYALHHHCQKFGNVEDGMGLGVHEFPSKSVRGFLKIFHRFVGYIPKELGSSVSLAHQAVVNPVFVIDFLRKLRQRTTGYIGNGNLSEDLFLLLFGQEAFRVNTPITNAWDSYSIVCDLSRTHLIDRVTLGAAGNARNVVVVSAGVTGRLLCLELSALFPQFYFFDFGSLLDLLMGTESRAWMELTSPDAALILEGLKIE